LWNRDLGAQNDANGESGDHSPDFFGGRGSGTDDLLVLWLSLSEEWRTDDQRAGERDSSEMKGELPSAYRPIGSVILPGMPSIATNSPAIREY